MTTRVPELSTAISTGSAEIDKRMEGGIPIGSLTLIEGQSDAGKSVLAQHLTFGSLGADICAVYYATENTVKSLIAQIGSLGLDVVDHFLVDRLRIYPLHVSAREINSVEAFMRLSRHMESLPDAFKVILVDSVTNIVTHSEESKVIDFFVSCKALCDEGRSIFMVVHSYAFDEGMLIRVRSLCDAHLKLRLEEVGERLVKMLEVSKVRNAERTTGNVISFEVAPGLGMRIVPMPWPESTE